jgi:hypothetical protein
MSVSRTFDQDCPNRRGQAVPSAPAPQITTIPRDCGQMTGRPRTKARGLGRGILHNGRTQLHSARILFGEYFPNDRRVPVRMHASDDGQNSEWFMSSQRAGSVTSMR